MAKKKEVKPKVVQTPPKKQEDDGCLCGLIVLGILVLVGGLVFGGYQYFADPKFEIGNCVVNRAGETMIVEDIYEYAEDYVMRPTTYIEYSNSDTFEIYADRTKDQFRKDIEYADSHYDEIDCER